MCLSIEVHAPDRVLGKGTHSGHDWVVVHNTGGYRCGYVRVSKGHPWHGQLYSNLDVEVHGGLTFGEADIPCDKPATMMRIGLDLTAPTCGTGPIPLYRRNTGCRIAHLWRIWWSQLRGTSKPNATGCAGRLPRRKRARHEKT